MVSRKQILLQQIASRIERDYTLIIRNTPDRDIVLDVIDDNGKRYRLTITEIR